MTSRERVIRAIEFRGPDRVPFNHSVFPGAFWRHGAKLVEFLNKYPDDFGHTRFEIPLKPEGYNERLEEYQDEWGSWWRRLVGYTTGEVIRPALTDWEDLKDYSFPPPPPQEHFDEIKARIEMSDHQWYMLGGGGNLFERMQFLRGTENLLVDLVEDRAELHELADRLVEYYVEIIKKYLACGVDGIAFGDDWGSQRSLLISPKKWREFFKPRYARMFQVVREAGAHVFFHSDGWTFDIMDDLIEIGVSVFNPQHPIMGTREVARRIGGRVCVRSDLDRQHILPHGSPREVRAHVKEVIEAFGHFNGGLILHGEVGPDVPMENIEAMYGAFREYGVY